MSVDLSLYRLIMDASLIVQLVMVILVVASVLSWLAILVKARTIKLAHRAADDFEERFWSGVDLAHLYDGVRRKTDMSGMEHVFSSGFKEFLRVRQHPPHVVDATHRSMRVAIARESEDLERYLQFLATVGSTSPYIGLFGTVWGIMHAFLGLSGVQQATLAMVAPGIAEALIATALGLFAAIPAVIAYNRFATDVDRVIGRFENFSDEFVALLARQTAGRGAADARE
ncbi:MotA/TolQ/ExbB proton channel family protein [Thioalkalivibrio nitratireducens DSM 14787]|uniref:Tol-Pal system protein TolQ n=1 Tax=Thioalkalivibrio nitratireducens (strain DSM 14787 / UNIQEM 213 / ALEN2) TaxID=1255043 RepID=L0E135_THIND|nr:protein TolQ [Thioalkalivibrio nitratireducens]AGA35008.1 MotA/TolQ/ExbB proton channel family protein [Thioalkalivibrio nitratireducens DSM 14787]